jgi:hypothetical protein
MPDASGGFTPAPAEPTPPISFNPLQPSFDAVELLPPAAAERLRKLRLRSADAHVVIPEFETIHQASMERVTAEKDLRRLVDHPQDHGFGLPVTDARVIAAQRTLDKATAEFRRLTELQEVRTAAWRQASAALQACEGYLRHGVPNGCTLEAVDVEPPKLAKNGGGLLDAIENRRRLVREGKAELHRIRSAPFTSGYAKQRMRAQVEAAAARGAIDISTLLELDGDIAWPTLSVQSKIYNTNAGVVGFHDAIEVVGLLAALVPELLIKHLDALIDAEAQDASALTHEQRQKAEADILSDLAIVEAEESALVWQAQTQSLPVEHRADCSPLAILGLRLVTAPRADPPGTTDAHAYDLVVTGQR